MRFLQEVSENFEFITEGSATAGFNDEIVQMLNTTHLRIRNLIVSPIFAHELRILVINTENKSGS